MIAASEISAMGRLTGKLYNLGKKIADESPEGLKHKDAIAFFEAYNSALEFKKHGQEIALPLHLHDKVDKNLRYILTATEANI